MLEHRREGILILIVAGVLACVCAEVASGCVTAPAAEPATAVPATGPTISDSPARPRPKLAIHEPIDGCYIGAYIDRDPLLKHGRMYNGRRHNDPDEFERIVGKAHAMYFFYLGYGKPLPMDWVLELKRKGKMVHIALEPNAGLDAVQDDEYLASLAKAMAASGAKILLRFASEMNGGWTPYHGDPEKYREKFRLVFKVMRKYAPNVALVWCPYTTPESNIQSYYPGDDYVDWVGVNMYNVTYFNQDRSTPARHVGPTDMLDFVYRTYSSRKPIMICEYGATNYSALENRSVTSFAVSCIQSLYNSLETAYPRVKCINYFNANALLIKSRKNNDYSVTSDPRVLAAYNAAIASDHFLSHEVDPRLGIPPPPLSPRSTPSVRPPSRATLTR